ncbi:hypothetical protein RE9431_29280 [Prescottella equi]|nr:hypothetical protein RE9414_29310 [Prescottella equi]BCN49616.1 hypothetical protein RE9416_29170 [Prescottella equi]BCN54607.1 hypothetical protein RE9425_29970 [Prescottella equi]BCN59569.1 hypothetical protein RE9427_29390 [Prescottella equi]BCN64473.1 hypothetical protein RE9431_29280 [Prescottella equi]
MKSWTWVCDKTLPTANLCAYRAFSPTPRVTGFSTRWRHRSEPRMSYIIFDTLLPYLGQTGAEYWAKLLMINPIGGYFQ